MVRNLIFIATLSAAFSMVGMEPGAEVPIEQMSKAQLDAEFSKMDGVIGDRPRYQRLVSRYSEIQRQDLEAVMTAPRSEQLPAELSEVEQLVLSPRGSDGASDSSPDFPPIQFPGGDSTPSSEWSPVPSPQASRSPSPELPVGSRSRSPSPTPEATAAATDSEDALEKIRQETVAEWKATGGESSKLPVEEQHNWMDTITPYVKYGAIGAVVIGAAWAIGEGAYAVYSTKPAEWKQQKGWLQKAQMLASKTWNGMSSRPSQGIATLKTLMKRRAPSSC